MFAVVEQKRQKHIHFGSHFIKNGYWHVCKNDLVFSFMRFQNVDVEFLFANTCHNFSAISFMEQGTHTHTQKISQEKSNCRNNARYQSAVKPNYSLNIQINQTFMIHCILFAETKHNSESC